MIYKNKQYIRAREKGATLFTALVFLILMTIVSVSAAKISMLDVMVAGNNQQRMELYQQTSNDLNNHTNPGRLIPLIVDQGVATSWTAAMPSDSAFPDREEKIENRVEEYNCTGEGLATSLGPDTPTCFLFDFEVKNKKQNSSAKEKHVRGAGKQFPRPSRNNYIH